MEKRLRKKYLRLIEEMNQKSQLRLPAIPALVDCFAIMMSEEEADFLLAVGQAHYSVDDLQQFSKRRGDDWQYFIQRIFAEGFLWMREVHGQQVAELAPIFPGWIEVALFRKEITPQRLQLLDKFQEILRMEELLNLPPVRMYWTWAKRKKLEQQPPTMTIAANGGRKKLVLNQKLQSGDSHSVETAGEIQKLLQQYGAEGQLALVHCFCRNISRLKGYSCQFHLPLEACIMVGSFAKQMVDYGIGRFITLEEAQALVQECQRKGAVHTVFHYGLDTTQPEIGICNCCWDCCCLFGSYNAGGLSNIAVRAHYKAVLVAPELCNGCGVCERFCPTLATGFDKAQGQVWLKDELCIGCGQCVDKCGRGVRALAAEERDVYIPTLPKHKARNHNFVGSSHA